MTTSPRPDTHRHMADPASPGPLVGEFEAIYTQHFTLVWRALRRFGVPPWSVEDAAQDVFLIWYRQRDGFRGDAQVSSYLYAIARRVAANVRRTARRTERRHQALEIHHEHARDSPGPEQAVADRQAAAAFHRAVTGLSSKLREVYLLSAQDGLTAQQIGLALGLSANTVSSRIRLARARLVAELRDQLPGVFTQDPDEPVQEARGRVWAMLVPLLPREQVAREAGRAAPLLVLTAALGLAAALIIPVLLRAPADGPTRPPPAAAPMPLVPASNIPAAPEPPPAQRPVLAPTPAPSNQVDSLAREARIVAAAQRHLRDGDPDAAIEQLRQHATRFAHGALAHERDALIAAALCQRGELASGLAAADDLAARAPASSALSAARAACEDPKDRIDE